jgi:hypothetical protein
MTEEPKPRGPSGTVMLDIGGDVGALIVYVDAELLGREIEARPAGHDARPAHAAVLERSTPDGPRHAVVIPALQGGRYDLWLDGEVRVGAAQVPDGGVVEVHLPGAPLPALRRL